MKLTWSDASVFAFVWACALGYIVASRILEWNFERFLPSNWYFVVKKRLAQPEAKSLRKRFIKAATFYECEVIRRECQKERLPALE